MTLLFHVDESADRSYHFHVGVLSDGAAVVAIEEHLEALVEEAFESGRCRYRSELHGVDLFHGEADWLKSKSSPNARIEVFEQALSVLSAHNVEVIARGANLVRFRRKYRGGTPYRWEFSNLLERLNERLHARAELGVVIADENHQYRALLQADVAEAKRTSTGGYRSQRLDRVLDAAHFVDSRLSRTVQLADLCAFVLRRRQSVPVEADARCEVAMDRLHGLVLGALPDPRGQFLTVRWDS